MKCSDYLVKEADGPCALKKKVLAPFRVEQSMRLLARHWESLNLLQAPWGILPL